MKSIAVVLFVALIQPALSSDLLELRMATLLLRVPATWHFSGTNGRAEGKGPDGEHVIANYRKLREDAPPEAIDHHWK